MPSETTVEEQNSFQRDQAAISAIMDESPPAEVTTETPSPTPPAAPPVEEAVVTPEPKAPALPEDPEKLDAYLETIQPKTKNQEQGYPVLKGHIKELDAKLKEQAKRLKELESEKESIKQLTPDIEEELKELRQLRKAEDPEKDPEIQSKYIAPIKSKNDTALNILKAHGLKPHLAELIEKAGGFSKIATSTEDAPSQFGADKTWAEVVEDVLLPNTPIADRKRLESIMAEALNLKDQMDQEVQGYKANSEERMKAKFEQMGNQFNEGLGEVAKSLGIMAQKWEPNEKATEAEKALCKEHNEMLDDVIKQISHFQQNISNPKEVGKMAALAGQTTYLLKANSKLVKTNEALEARAKELEDKLQKIKGAGAAHRSNAPQVPQEPKVDKNQNSRQAVEKFFTALDNA